MGKPSQGSMRSKHAAMRPARGENAALSGKIGELCLVATPIGNLGDLSPRAASALAEADLILCEDKRVTVKLIAHLGLKKPLRAYHDHNAEAERPRIMAELGDGRRLVLVSDAGTPLISDPGYKLAREASALGHRVTAIPGPSAPILALVLSGLPTDRFFFLGFLPAKSAARADALREIADLRASLIVFETAPRLAASLGDMLAILGDRPAAVAREMTKLYEEIRRAPLSELLAHYREAGPPKGEIVIVIGPPDSESRAREAVDLDAELQAALSRMSVKDAVAAIAAATGHPKRDLYRRALALLAAARDPAGS